jgi:hypothetical protein
MRCAVSEVNLAVLVREEGGLFCAKGDRMIRIKAAPRLSFSGFARICCLVATSACASAPAGVIGKIEPPEREFTMVGIESELFAAVVRAQLAAGDGEDAYPHRLDRFRFDARPYGTNTGYPEVFAGVEGVDPTLSFARASEREIDRVIESRKETLQANAVREGRLVPYAQCAGAGVPVPPPPRGRSSARRAKPVDVHAGCPKTPEYYLTVGLPLRGQPEGLKDIRDTRGDKVRLRGEVWTILVDETALGPHGWRRSQYAWLFKRNDEGVLELANTILVGVVE